MCNEAFPRMEDEQCTLVQGNSLRVRCLNIQALGEQWIEKVTEARVSGRAQKEGEHLEFRAHIKGWEMGAKKRRCNTLLQKSDCNLRDELLKQRQKDVLLILYSRSLQARNGVKEQGELSHMQT
jgi:hypothetical protein